MADVSRHVEGALPSNGTPVYDARNMATKVKRKFASGFRRPTIVRRQLQLPRPCCVYGCRSNTDGSRKNDVPVPVFPFPDNKAAVKRWRDIVWTDNWKPPASSVVCAVHFQPDDFITSRKIIMPDGSVERLPLESARLRTNAVPSKMVNSQVTKRKGTVESLELFRLDDIDHEEVIGDASSTQKIHAAPSDILEWTPTPPAGVVKCLRDSLGNGVNAPVNVSECQQSGDALTGTLIPDSCTGTERRIDDHKTAHHAESDKLRRSSRKRLKSQYLKRNETYKQSRQSAKRSRDGARQNGVDCIGIVLGDTSRVPRIGLTLDTAESPRVHANFQELVDGQKSADSHQLPFPYVQLRKMAVMSSTYVKTLSEGAGVYTNEHDYAETSHQVKFYAPESDVLLDDHFEEVIMEDMLDSVWEDTKSNLDVPGTGDVNLKHWTSPDINGNMSDESDSINAFSECPARFDGSPGSSVDAFIDCIETYRKANVIRQIQALRDFHALLAEEAAVWWSSAKCKVKDWPQAVSKLRVRFTAPRSTVDVYRDIIKSVRGENETHTSFAMRVLTLFSEITYSVQSFMKIDLIYALLDDNVREFLPRSRLSSAEDLFDNLSLFDESLNISNKKTGNIKNGFDYMCRNFVNVIKCSQCKETKRKLSALQVKIDSSAVKECIECYKRGLCEKNLIKLPCEYCKKLADKLVALQNEYMLSVKLLEGRSIDNDDEILDLRCTVCCVQRDQLTRKSKTCVRCVRINADVDTSLRNPVICVDNAGYIEGNCKLRDKFAVAQKINATTKCRRCDIASIGIHEDVSVFAKKCDRCVHIDSKEYRKQMKRAAMRANYAKRVKNTRKKDDSILSKALEMSDISTESKIEIIGDCVDKPKSKITTSVISLPGITIKPIRNADPKSTKRKRFEQNNIRHDSIKSNDNMTDSPIDRTNMNLFIRVILNDSMNIMAMLDPLAKNNFLSEKLFQVLLKTNYKFNELSVKVSIHGRKHDVQNVLSTLVFVNIQGKRLEIPFWYMEGIDDKTRLGEDFIRDAAMVIDKEREVWYFEDAPNSIYPLEMKA